MRQQAVRQVEELACVVLPQEEMSLLVPNDCVAEILPWRRVKPASDLPSWCLGTVGWRAETVVVLDFHVLAGLNDQPRVNRRALVVMNRTTKGEGTTFYAIASSGLPRLMHLAEDELRDAGDKQDSPSILSMLMLGTEMVVVPSLRYLEDQVGMLFQSASAI